MAHAAQRTGPDGPGAADLEHALRHTLKRRLALAVARADLLGARPGATPERRLARGEQRVRLVAHRVPDLAAGRPAALSRVPRREREREVQPDHRARLADGRRDHVLDHLVAVHPVLELDERAVAHAREPDRLSGASLAA